MLKNFFTTASRVILRQKTYAIINFVGLTCGVALALLIFAYVRSEVSYDRFHEKAERIYRIRYEAPNGLVLATSPPPIAPAMRDFFPEVETACRMYGRNVSIRRPDQAEAFEESDVYFADSSLTDIFTIEYVKGNPKRALYDEFTVLITEEMATKYFGDEDPVGQPLLFAGKHAFTVIGVVKDFPENSHLRFHMLVPYENMYDMENDQAAELMRKNFAMNFVISHAYTYVLLKPGADPARVDGNMNAFLEKYAQPQLRVGQKFTLLPLTDIHLTSDILAEPSSTTSVSNLLIFVAVGLITLLIACINYINLSTAQSFTRIKEIGIRVIMGSGKTHIVLQFLSESFLFCLVSLVLSFGVFYAALPYLNELTGKALRFTEVIDLRLILVSVAILLGMTLLAGGYPAYFVSRFNSVASLKGEGTPGSGSQWLRRTLVVFQMAIASLLMVGSLAILEQLRFLQDRPLGFQREHVITVPLFSANMNGIFSQRDSVYRSRLQSFRDEIEALAGVHKTTLSSNAPGLGAIYRGAIPEGFTQEDNLFVANFSVDYDFNETYGMELVTGRWFSRDYGTDPAEGFIVNETAVREYKWESPGQALGKTINREGKKGKVIGVLKDFNFTSLTSPVTPVIIELNPNQFNALSIRFDNEQVDRTIEAIEARWNALFPEKAFEFSFLDEQLNSQYAAYTSFGAIIRAFTAVAILISCLGVYGLVLFVVQRKVKEIGVRKVLGASVTGILQLIYREFVVLVIVGFMLAIPLSYYLLDQWLGNFTYRITLDVLIYAGTLFLLLLVTLLTISHQAIRASLANPVKSLRSE